MPAATGFASTGSLSFSGIHQVISKYGEIQHIQQKGKDLVCQVKITQLSRLFDACSSLARISPLKADGNNLSLNTPAGRILICNRV